MMINKYVIIAISAGVFLAGIGIGYAVISTPYSSSTLEMEQMIDNPQKMQQMHNMMISDRQHMDQMMKPMMEKMMENSQMRQQMIDMMMQDPEMMSSMKQHRPMTYTMMSSEMIGNSVKMSNPLNNNDVNLLPKMKQNKNQIGMMMQDSELRQQMQELLLQNINVKQVGTEILARGQSSDETVFVEIASSTPLPGKFLEITEAFHDKDGNVIEHVNHGIHIIQDEQTVLKMSELHSHQGEITYYTRALHSESPIKIEISMNGIGMEEPLTGPMDELIIIEVS